MKKLAKKLLTMKKLIIILSVIFIYGCEKEPIDIPDLPQNPDTSQWWNDDEEEWATLIISGDIIDTIIYVFSQFDDIYKDCYSGGTMLNLDMGDYGDFNINCRMPIDTIGTFNCSFTEESCNEYYFWCAYTLYPNTDSINNNISFTSGNMIGEITEYGKVWDMVKGTISGNLCSDNLDIPKNIDFELIFCMNREKNYYY